MVGLLFLNIIIAFCGFVYFKVNSLAIVFLVAVSIIFCVGLIDDLRDWSPKRKIIFELLAIFLFILGTETYIQDLLFIYYQPTAYLAWDALTALAILFLVQVIISLMGLMMRYFMFDWCYLRLSWIPVWFIDDYLFLSLCVTCLATYFTLWFNISKPKRFIRYYRFH